MTDLESRVAVVTGASRGLGRVIADALRARGVRVAEVARSSGTFRADVAKAQDVRRLKADVEATLGTPTILVNAAGVFGPVALLRDGEPSEWIETVMVDLIGPYLTCHAFVGGMIEDGWGRIINLSSAGSLRPPAPAGSAYGTAKAALNQLTRHLAAELVGTGVTANAIHPGDVLTDMSADVRKRAALAGPEGESFREFGMWMQATGGDPPQKAAELVLRILESDVNGAFLWIDEPAQTPVSSWDPL
jgi:NAD(P)-dependent dehydrogenase (short-subunit alcohol dehydrogenase family)